MTGKRLFVMGSFSEGQVHSLAIEKYIVDRKAAETEAFVLRLPVGYPCLTTESFSLVKNASPQKVCGELIYIEAPDVVHHVLDEFHGVSLMSPEKSLHFKQEIQVWVDGATVDAMAYVINPAKLPKGSQLIEDGDWKSNMSDRPAITSYLGAKHVSYMRKLSQTSGRQVVPYDLQLSRDLMKMELIVDKGRRLALTKLGKEALRYLPE